MKWPERLALAAAGLGALGLWLPWVAHPAAALMLTGLDLPEFVRFMGEYRAGQLAVQPLAFAAPILVFSLAGAISAGRSGWTFWGRLLALAGCLWLLTVPFPPLERRGALLLAAVAVASAHVASVYWQPPSLWLAAASGALAVIAACSPLWQFQVMLPALNRLYGRPVSYGAGVYLEIAAALVGLLAIGAAARAMWSPALRTAEARPAG